MKLFSVIFYISTIVCLQAPHIYCSEITPAPKEQMINPPLFPFDKSKFALGLCEGFVLPVIGIAAMTSPAERHFAREYYTLLRNPEKAAEHFAPYEKNKGKSQNHVLKYIEIRSALALNDHATTEKLIEEYNATPPCSHKFDIRSAHNWEYQILTGHLNEQLGILIGSTISACACIYGLYYLYQSLPERPICKTTCTTVCMPPTIDDLD